MHIHQRSTLTVIFTIAMTAFWLGGLSPAEAKSVDSFKSKDGHTITAEYSGEKLEIMSFSFGAENMSNDGEDRGRLKVPGVVLTKAFDANSGALATAAQAGTSFPDITIIIRKDTGEDVAAFEIKMVIVSSYTINSDDDGMLVEEVILNFEQADWSYFNQGTGGTTVEGSLFCTEPTRCTFGG